MVLEIADIHVLPGKQAEFEAAIECGLRTVHTWAKGMRRLPARQERRDA